MILDIIIAPGGKLWWKMLLLTVTIFGTVFTASIYFNCAKEMIRKICGAFLLALAISIHPYLYYEHEWTLRSSLPLQLCSLSGILSGVVLLFPFQLGYELLMYWGLSGAIHSLLTPEMTQGNGEIILWEYYLSHGGIILAAMMLTYSTGMQLRRISWWKIFLFTQFLLPVIGLVNFLLSSNYMYLREKPLADNPLVIGQWPWYILFLNFFLLLHFILIYLFFYTLRKSSSLKRIT
jgi:hypothetical integral membrane protein (TIGR02206 family)